MGADTDRALVLDAERRQAIVLLRNLGRHGVDVTAGATGRLVPGGYSKYASRSFRYPAPSEDEDAFLDAIEAELAARPCDVVVPVTAATVPAVVRNRDRLEPDAVVPYPPYETLVTGLDKLRTTEAARAAGVRVPRTIAPDTLDPAVVEETVGYPAVVKPRRASGCEGVVVCESRADLEATFPAVRDRYGPSIVQEFIPNGGELGVYTLYDCASELVGLTVQQRVRTNPPGGGPSTMRRTVEAPELVRAADDLLSSMDWRGVAMVEFRIDERTGEPTLLEINPRFWGSLSLSVRAGVEFPYMLYRLATEGTTEPALEYRVGARTRNLLGEVGHLLRRDDTWTALGELLSAADEPAGYDVASRDDPTVAFAFGIRAVGDFLERRFARPPGA